MARTSTIALAAAGVLAIVAAGFVGIRAGTDHADQTAGTSTSSTPSARPGGSPTPSSGATSPSGGGSTTTGSTGTTGDPGVADEVLPTPSANPTATGGGLPPVPTAKPTPLVGGTLPKPASATGRLVAGFPSALAPPRGVSVESSSLAVARDVLQLALVTSGGDPLTTLLHYRTVMSAHGFTEKSLRGVEDGSAVGFRKGKNSLTIASRDGHTYLIANLSASAG